MLHGNESENRPLISNNDIIVQIMPDISPELNQDVMNKIASYVSYKHGLSIFRQTSRSINKLIEETPAGQLARKANDHQLNTVRKALDSCMPDDCSTWHCNLIKICAGFGGSIGFWGLYFYWVSSNAFSSPLNLLLSAGTGAGVGALIPSIISVGLFRNRSTVEAMRQEVNTLHDLLQKPYCG